MQNRRRVVIEHLAGLRPSLQDDKTLSATSRIHTHLDLQPIRVLLHTQSKHHTTKRLQARWTADHRSSDRRGYGDRRDDRRYDDRRDHYGGGVTFPGALAREPSPPRVRRPRGPSGWDVKPAGYDGTGGPMLGADGRPRYRWGV